MAFFGLTKLGEQNLFHARSKDGNDLTLFANSDFSLAFDQTVGENAVELDMDALPKYFEKLYCGPLYPQAEVDCLKDQFEGCSAVGKAELVRALIEMKEKKAKSNEECKTRIAAEFTSNALFRDAARRNARLKLDPFHKYCQPVVSSHEVGWDLNDSKFGEMDKKHQKRFPKVSSAETKFASAMYESGLI